MPSQLAKRAIVATFVRVVRRRSRRGGVVTHAKRDIGTEQRLERAQRRRGFRFAWARHRMSLDGGRELNDKREDRDPGDKN